MRGKMRICENPLHLHPRRPPIPSAKHSRPDDSDFGHLPEAGLRAMVEAAHRLGFRKSELKNLPVMQVASGWTTLFAGAKNGKPRKSGHAANVRRMLQRQTTG